MNVVRLGVIGIGNMGSEHCRTILAGKVAGLRITAVADRREDRRRWAEEAFAKSAAVFSEGEELIDSGLCDAVLIATPHYQHPTLAIKAFSKGLDVLSEKPIGVYTKEVRREIEAAQKSGRTFALMFNQRTNCVYRKLREIIESGELGIVKRVNWTITDWYRTQRYYDSGTWRATWAGEGGGALINQCPHQLDLLWWLFGMPTK
ncbi:MAG: Gfo/Idh/MocA family oxidoreductase, partial [Eubacteriales bacterium]|nr:Gfo/Idh/MocA family oxidoreductase [Eubacteriales bacterium]